MAIKVDVEPIINPEKIAQMVREAIAEQLDYELNRHRLTRYLDDVETALRAGNIKEAQIAVEEARRTWISLTATNLGQQSVVVDLAIQQ
ncbi:hypothetical protein SEA_RAYMOND7_59 [Mycobacterium phage Raymond7]|uniref:Uncharacterized protein n=7 Tax=Charlievirus TaxID=1623280 RepID=A0AA48V6N4_9CAUD|nr:hypothetical protein CL59_gp65 [Mycobacterium phage Redi]YP_010051860.1 hypothetical protein KD927_gp59 [Mycobacterium phage Raymond7]YP_010052269.1 hypothetical protein KD933_gp62 [Mycobacterium phage Rebel]QAY16048.1 hypothetical protein SEA_BABERUTH_66 [Mycobacterium phage BabeRuth]QBI99193.1 hypothetical protein SEA_NENAE_66 [Mycobacterium phage Nenae]QBI99262.1 hypothetical protein SEA_PURGAMENSTRIS_66 [Mycobacterium phage Purgamenstris]QBI99935.1 hypothetical protein SEA_SHRIMPFRIEDE